MAQDQQIHLCSLQLWLHTSKYQFLLVDLSDQCQSRSIPWQVLEWGVEFHYLLWFIGICILAHITIFNIFSNIIEDVWVVPPYHCHYLFLPLPKLPLRTLDCCEIPSLHAGMISFCHALSATTFTSLSGRKHMEIRIWKHILFIPKIKLIMFYVW